MLEHPTDPVPQTPGLPRLGGRAARPLRVAMIAPPWLPVPPPGYGGIESVIAALVRGLHDLGHEVTLFAPPQSSAPGEVISPLARPYPEEMGKARQEADHVAAAFEAIRARHGSAQAFDVVHDHCEGTTVALANTIPVPVVHTLHGPFTQASREFYAHHATKAWYVALSRAQAAAAPPGVRLAGVVPNPLELDRWPLRREKRDFLLWVGRFAPEKGAHTAIAVARRAGRPLVLGGVVQPGQQEFFQRSIAPHVDGDRVRFAGEIGGERKVELFAGAAALLMPITWEEPFGMVMAEAMACGTPVLAFPAGSTPELVEPGVTGFLAEGIGAMADAVGRLGEIDPDACRAAVERRCGMHRVAALYAEVYERALGEHAAHGTGAWSAAPAS